MAFSKDNPGRSLAELTPAMARALRCLHDGGVLVAHGCDIYSIGRELFGTPTAQTLIGRGFVTRPQDLFQPGADAGRITDIGRTALDWHGRRVAA